jgi:S-adenosylmethionine-dependent methyltransferase
MPPPTRPVVAARADPESEAVVDHFDAGAKSWAQYNASPLGRIRHAVTWHNLSPHLPAVPGGERQHRVLDVGGGSGELALALVERGYRVWLLDSAAAMLDRARRAALDLPGQSRTRLTLCRMEAEDAPRAFPAGFFDAIACHTLIEYLPEPRQSLTDLSTLLGDGALLSVSFANRHSEVLRRVWSCADPAAAMVSLQGNRRFRSALFDLTGMAYTVEEVGGWLSEIGLVLQAACGVRVFADFLPRERLDDPGFFEALLRLEKEASALPPYSRLAHYGHVIARRPAHGQPPSLTADIPTERT